MYEAFHWEPERHFAICIFADENLKKLTSGQQREIKATESKLNVHPSQQPESERRQDWGDPVLSRVLHYVFPAPIPAPWNTKEK